MANYALLNNVQHKDLKVNIEKSAAMGNNQMYAPVFPFEYKEAQSYYPIFFQKDSEGGYFSIALFGFEQGENLYLGDKGWTAEYVPLMVEKEPFLIGFQKQKVDGEEKVETVIHIDMDSPRVNAEEGVPVFLPHGGNSDYLSRISGILKKIYDSQDETNKFYARIKELDLLESFNLDVTLRDGSVNRLAGLYTVNEDKVRGLPDETLLELNKTGMLELLYMLIASLANIRKIAGAKVAQG